MKNCRVASGSAAPAETHFLRLRSEKSFALAAISRYMDGEAKHTLALNLSIVQRSVSTVCSSASTVEAPKRIGKHSRAPRPNVEASGGVPQNTSSLCVFRMERGKQSHIATTSRWKCMAPLGAPAPGAKAGSPAPDVKAISATSSAEVATLVNHSGWRRTSESSESSASSSQYLVFFRVGHVDDASVSSGSKRLSHSAWVIPAFAIASASSFAPSSGPAVTQTPPAFITANQHATIIGLFGPRSSTRWPGLSPISRTSTLARRFAWVKSCV